MKVYFAAAEPNDLKIANAILLSYYDIYIQFAFQEENMDYNQGESK